MWERLVGLGLIKGGEAYKKWNSKQPCSKPGCRRPRTGWSDYCQVHTAKREAEDRKMAARAHTNMMVEMIIAGGFWLLVIYLGVKVWGCIF